MNKILAAAALALLLGFPVVSLAAVFQDGKKSFELTAPVMDDLYVAGERIDIGQPVRDDLFAGGELVEVTAQIGADAYVAGGTVRVLGPVDDDVHAAGQRLEVMGAVAGDMFAAGREVTLGPEATVGKDLYVAGDNVVIAGAVSGAVRAAGGVTIASTARISGDLTVYGNEEPVIEEGATIGGTVSRQAPPERPNLGGKVILLGWVRSVVSLFVLSLVFTYGARAFSRQVVEGARQATGKAALTGAVWLLLFIPASIILLITLVGIPLAVLVVLLTILTYLAATGIAAAGLGKWVLGKLSKDSGPELTWVHALVGAVVYKGVQLFPVIGWLATFILVLIFFGVTLLTLLKLLKHHDSHPGFANPHPDSPSGVGTPD